VTKTLLLLLFRGRPEHLRDERQSGEDQQNHETSDEESEEASVIVQLTNRVQDGTRCRPGSLDMCIQGKCQVRNNLKVNEKALLNFHKRKNFFCKASFIF
jgi:hypothetical protein